MTFHLASVAPDGLFEVRFGLGGYSQLRPLSFGLPDVLHLVY